MKDLGCWKDSWDRALPKMIKYHSWGMTPAKCLSLTENLDLGKYSIFGVENGVECWAAVDMMKRLINSMENLMVVRMVQGGHGL